MTDVGWDKCIISIYTFHGFDTVDHSVLNVFLSNQEVDWFTNYVSKNVVLMVDFLQW